MPIRWFQDVQIPLLKPWRGFLGGVWDYGMGLVTKHIELQTTYWLLVENVQGAFLDVEIAQSHDIIFPVIFFSIYIYIYWLVVWSIIFPYVGNVIIPTDFHFFRGVGIPPTSIYIYPIRILTDSLWLEILSHEHYLPVNRGSQEAMGFSGWYPHEIPGLPHGF